MKRVSFGRLPNGFRFYTQYDPRAHVSGIGVGVGSVHDPRLRRGTAHLAEHVLARYNREEELKFIEYGCGPDQPGINIRTTYENTYFGTNLLLRKRFGLELFDIMARRLGSGYSYSDVRSEQAAVLSEHRLRGTDWFENEIEPLLCEAMYDRNPVRNRIDCEPKELIGLRLRELNEFIRKHYVASNMFAVLLDVPFHKARRLCEEKFSDLPQGEVPKLLYDGSESRPRFNQPKLIEVTKRGISLYHVVIAFPTFPTKKQNGEREWDGEAIDVLAKIWEFRMRLVLRNENTDPKKGAYRVLAFTPQTSHHGMMYLWFATPDLEFARYGAERALKECVDLQTRYVLDDELGACTGFFRHDYIDDFSNAPPELAERIVHAATSGDEEMHGLNSYLGRLARVGRGCLLRVAKKYMPLQGYVQILVHPE